MALKLQKYINQCGYEIDNGYFELSEILYNYNINLFEFKGNIYLSKEHKDNGFEPIGEFVDNFELPELPNGNITEFTYNYIKNIANKGRNSSW